MHLQKLRIKNYRRLRDVLIDLEAETSIFVGANNSGKTSAMEVLKSFFRKGERFSIHDFSVDIWSAFEKIGSSNIPLNTSFPTISIDLWFKVAEGDIHRIIKLLPSLDWDNTAVGLRLEYAPKNNEELLANFKKAKEEAAKHIRTAENVSYHPWPETLFDYLKKRLSNEYETNYYVLDFQKFNNEFNQEGEYSPHKLGNEQESGSAILSSLLRIDFMSAQRHLSDDSKGQGESLSKRLNGFYERNLEKFDGDFSAVEALAKSEDALNDHFKSVFDKTLQNLNKIGYQYPGFTNPHLEIRSILEPETLMTRNAGVYYALRDPGKEPEKRQRFLPDKYNGLGFKNLIYMVVEVLDFHEQWKKELDKRPPLHVVLVEEPEAHLHVQLQQVFIREIRKIIPDEEGDFVTQIIVTTHSPHILYESGFGPIRYFRRMAPGHYSEVLNLSTFQESDEDTKRFLFQYIKLTHCDLFFADAAILVEGNVERLLLPLMISRVSKELKSSYLSILEVGGAFAHKFKNLVHFLGLTTLVITDLDSVQPGIVTDEDEEVVEDIENEPTIKKGRVCPAWKEGAETSNYTLSTWLPGLTKVSELLAADDKKKCPDPTRETPAKIMVAYQTKQEVTWKMEKDSRAGRTFEEAFAYENLEWCQDNKQKALGLRVKQSDNPTLETIAQRIHKKIKGSSFRKTEFALAVMVAESEWLVPIYIADGLRWLKEQVSVINIEK